MASGTINGTTSNRFITVKVVWTSVKDELNNYSTVIANLYARKSSDSTEGTVGTGTWYITIDGQTVSKTVRLTVEPNNTWVLIGSSTKVVNHAEDGTRSIIISASGGITSSATSWTSTTLSGTAVMDNIPRQTVPTFDADTKDFGQSVHISLNPAANTHYHSIYYIWGGNTVLIAENVGTGYDFTIPLSLMNDIPSSTSAALEFSVTTYRENGSVVGSASRSITCTVPTTVKPTINSIAVSDSGTQVPAAWGIYIKGMSILHVNVSASGQYGSTVTGYEITALGVTQYQNDTDIAEINQSGSISISVTVTDSRGRSTTNSTAASVTVYDYEAPQLNAFQAVRCNQYGTPVDNGEYIKVSLDCSISPLNGNNSMTVRIYTKRSDAADFTLARTITPQSDTYTGSPVIGGGLIDPSYSFAVRVEVEDITALAWAEGTIAAEGAIISWRDGGLGIAFGKSAEENNVADFAWEIHGRAGARFDVPLPVGSGGTGNNSGQIPIGNVTFDATSAAAFVTGIKAALLDALYPVGSLYITTGATSPATLFGGTWVQVKDTFLLAAGDTYDAGDTGGSATAQIAAHRHISPIGSRNSNQNIAINPSYKRSGTVTFAADGKPAWTGSNNTVKFTDVQAYNTSEAGGQTIDTLPPYLAVNVWERTA